MTGFKYGSADHGAQYSSLAGGTYGGAGVVSGLDDRRVPSRGWHVEVDHPDGRTVRPVRLDDPQYNPSLNALPRVRIPVPHDDSWLDADWEGQPLRVYHDGLRLPIEELVNVDITERGGTKQAVLEGLGGVELLQRVRRQYDSQETHTAASNLITNQTTYVANVDDPDPNPVESEQQSATTTSEFDSVTSLGAADPVNTANDETKAHQTCFLSEGENHDRSSSGITVATSTDYSGDAPDDGFGAAARLDANGEAVEFDFSTSHTIPEADVGVAIRLSGASAHADFYLDGQLIDTVSSGGSLVTAWNDVGDGTFDGSGWTSGDLAAGTHTVRVEATDSSAEVDVDVVTLYDQRFSYNFDNTVTENANGNMFLDGPQPFPNALPVTFSTVPTVLSVVAARVDSTIDDTTGTQKLEVSNDGGLSWLSASNTQTLDKSFADAGGSVTFRVTLGRYGSTNTTPATGINPQTLADYTLFADLADIPVLVNQSFEGNVEDVLQTMAEDHGNFIWQVQLDAASGITVEWTRPGQRTADREEAIASYEVTKTGERVVTKAFVSGSSQQAVDERFSANHGTAVDLDHDNLQQTRESVSDPSTGAGFERGTDYTIDWEAGTITTLAGGSITDGSEVSISYWYETRGSYEAPEYAGAAREEAAFPIPGLTTDRGCEQAALQIVQRGKTPLYEATVEIPKTDANWSLVDDVSLEDVPTNGEHLEIRDLQQTPTGVTLQLGSRRRIREVVDDLQSRVRSISERT